MDYNAANSSTEAALLRAEEEAIAVVPPQSRWVPRCLRYDHGPPEATGLCLDFYARAYIVMSSVFLGPALLQLAFEAANCESEEECDAARVMGMKPSSLLANIAVASGLLSALAMPIIGAAVDHTPYRLQVGAYSAYVLSAIKLIQVMVNSSTWFFVAWLEVLSVVLYYIHSVASYAYMSELSKDTAEQTKYNTSFFTSLYASTLVFLAQILFLSNVFQQSDISIARTSQVITGIASGGLFLFSWSFFFRPRPQSSTLPPDESLWTIGFSKVYTTSGEIYRTMPALKRLMGSVLFAGSAMNTIVTISTTYMSAFLGMDSDEIGVIFLVVLIMGIPGAKLGEWLALTMDPLASAKICIILFIFSTTMAALVLTGSESKQYAVIFGALWGIGLGWLHPMHTVMFLGLTPDHARTEYMGIFIFCQQVLSWLPPLVFSILNELGVSMALGLASLNIFFLLGLICLFSMGQYHQLDEAPSSSDNITVELPTEGQYA